MKCFVTKNELGVSLTVTPVSEDGKTIGTPQTVQVAEGKNLSNVKYSVLLEACDKPQPVDLPF